MQTQTVESVFMKARFRLMRKHRLYGALAMNLKPVFTADVKTASTDGVRIFVNPENFMSRPIESQEFCLAHEALHPALKHIFRLKNMDPDLGNIAADHVVNLILKDDGFTIPEGRFCDEKYKGWSMEQVYRDLAGNPQPPPPDAGDDDSEDDSEDGDDGGQDASQSPESGDGTDDSDGNDASDTGDKGGEDADQGGESGEENGGEGEGDDSGQESQEAGGEDGESGDTDGGDPERTRLDAENAELMQKDFGGSGSFLHAAEEAKDGESASDLEKRWENAMAAAMMIAARCGDLPDALKIAFENARTERLPWYDILRNLFNTVVAKDWNWSRPNRRHIGRDIYLPTMRRGTLSDVVIAVDTSGSVVDRCGEFLGHVSDILAEFETNVHVLFVDTIAHYAGEFTNSDLPLDLQPVGGGGTDFVPPFEWVEENGVNPTVLIYLTDLECWSYPPEPEYPTVWVSVRPGTAPFGDVIVMD